MFLLFFDFRIIYFRIPGQRNLAEMILIIIRNG